MDDVGRFEQLMKACHCCISIITHEERYALEIVRNVAVNLRKDIWIWSAAEGVREAFRTLMEGTKRQRPDARLAGVLVSPMMGGGVETILGIHRDPVFGPVVMFGLGGVLVEVLDDVSFRVAPFGEDEARNDRFGSR